MTAPLSPEQAHAAYVAALSAGRLPMTPAEEAIPAEEWPSPMSGAGADALLARINAGHMPAVDAAEATDRLLFMVEHVTDDEPDPAPKPELDALSALMKELTFAVLSLQELSHEIELRRDDGQPPTPLHIRSVNTALHTLRSDIARCAYHFAQTGGPA